MSLFFDVWSSNGFVLASDVKLTTDGQEHYIHKVIPAISGCRVPCAIAACGDYLQASLDFFLSATSRGNTLREIARCFAKEWTKRYAGTRDYSAVHLVGYERIPGTDKLIPQLWYWRNWEREIGYLDEARLNQELSTFDSQEIPANSHLPWKIREITGKFPGGHPEEEYYVVMSFLRLNEPFFTWNGDTTFWRSAGQAVGSALSLLWQSKTSWSIQEIGRLARICLDFLAKTGELLPQSSVGYSPDGKFDILAVMPTGIEWIERSEFVETT